MLNVLMFYGVYAGGLFASFFRSPIYAFALYEAVYFFNPQKRWWGNIVPDLSYSFFVVIAMLSLLIINWKVTKQNEFLKVPPLKWMYLLLALYGLAYFYAVLPDFHAQYLGYYFNTILIVSVAYKLCDTDKKLDLALYGYIFGAWYIGFVAFQVGRNAYGGRVEGIGTVDAPDANGIAAAIAPTLVLCLFYFWTSKKWLVRGAIVVAGLFIANGLVLINSRGAFLAVGLSIGYFMTHMFFSSFQRQYQKLTAVFITIFGLMGAVAVVDQSSIERMLSIGETEVNLERESGATRIVFWKSAITMSFDYPMGTGYQGFNYYAPFYLPQNLDTGGSRNRTVHSSWFEALTEVGYLGLFVFCMMIWTSYKSLKKCRTVLKDDGQVDQYFKVIAIEGALIAFLVAMTFLNRMRAEVLYWCILYAACAYNIYVLKHSSIISTSQRKTISKYSDKAALS